MKLSNSKQQLAKIIRDNGGWRDGVAFSVSTRGGLVIGSRSKPRYTSRYGWVANGGFFEDRIKLRSYLKNWHQTIVSRAEFFHLYPAPDADGWIEWKGGECPIERGAIVDIKFRSGATYEMGFGGSEFSWDHEGVGLDIISYRLHKPAKESAESERTIIETVPTIEQLASDYRAKLEIVQRAQEEADYRRCGAEAALEKLVAAGKALGLVLSVEAPEPELAITDWRDLQKGDEVECLQINITGDDYADDRIGSIGLVVATEEPGKSGQAVKMRFDDGDSYWIVKWRFIRRP